MPGDDTSTYAPKSPDFSSIFAAPGPTQSQSPNPSTQAYQHSPQQHHQHQQHFHQPSPQQQQQQPPHHPHHQQPPHNPQPGQDYSLDPSAYGGYIPPPYGSHHSPSAYHNPPPLKSEYQEHFPPDQYLSPNQPPHPHYPPQQQHPGLYGQQQQPVYHQQPPLYGQPAFQEQPLFPGQDPYAQQQPPYHHPPGGGFPTSPGAQIKAEHEAVQSNMPPRRTAAQPAPVIDPSPVRTKFPTARIKRIMQADEEVGKVAQQTPIAVGKALEMFMVQLVSKSADIAKEKGSKRVTAHMLKQVVETDEQWDFLRDIVSKVENEKEGAKAKAKAESDSEEEEAAETKKRGRGGRRKKA